MKWTYKFYNKQRRWASTLFIVFLSLMLKGSRINNIRFTSAVRPRTGEVVPACKNCTSIFKEAFR